MVRQFDDISRAIGNLEGQFASHARQTASDLQILRESVDKIVKSMDNLPPSPHCLEAHIRIDRELNSIRVNGAKHVGFVSGIAVSGSLFLQWLLSKFGIFLTGK